MSDESIRNEESGMIVVIGRRWLDRKNGNTYHSVRAITGCADFYSTVTYGYEDQYKQTAYDLLRENRVPSVLPLSYVDFIRSPEVKFEVTDVTRKADLSF